MLNIQRPSNPIWEVLAEIVSQVDARAEEGESPDEIFADATGYDMGELIEGSIRDEVFTMIMASKEFADRMSFTELIEASWIGGFGHGANDARGIDIYSYLKGEPDTKDERMSGRMYAGVDEESINYLAQQRSMRIALLDPDSTLSREQEMLVLLLASYVDGFQCGAIFESR